jgi:hypothetical protein
MAAATQSAGSTNHGLRCDTCAFAPRDQHGCWRRLRAVLRHGPLRRAGAHGQSCWTDRPSPALDLALRRHLGPAPCRRFAAPLLVAGKPTLVPAPARREAYGGQVRRVGQGEAGPSLTPASSSPLDDSLRLADAHGCFRELRDALVVLDVLQAEARAALRRVVLDRLASAARTLRRSARDLPRVASSVRAVADRPLPALVYSTDQPPASFSQQPPPPPLSLSSRRMATTFSSSTSAASLSSSTSSLTASLGWPAMTSSYASPFLLSLVHLSDRRMVTDHKEERSK